MTRTPNRLIWIDCEMTGLAIEKNSLLEISVVVTDDQLAVIAQGPCIVINQRIELLESMDEWNTTHHKKSGLYEQVLTSTIKMHTAEAMVLDFLKEYCKEGTSPLCGNSIHHDRSFLKKYMPQLESFFHYRHIDVSTIKELALRWNPSIIKGFVKKGTHRALDDILESIEELRYYKQHFFTLTTA